MGFCIWGISWLSCGMEGIFRFFINLFYPNIPSFVLFFIALVASSIALYFFAKMVGWVGGIIMTILGIVGMAFSAGTTSVIAVLGAVITVVMFFFKKPTLIIVANVALFIICALCYGL